MNVNGQKTRLFKSEKNVALGRNLLNSLNENSDNISPRSYFINTTPVDELTQIGDFNPFAETRQNYKIFEDLNFSMSSSKISLPHFATVTNAEIADVQYPSSAFKSDIQRDEAKTKFSGG